MKDINLIFDFVYPEVLPAPAQYPVGSLATAIIEEGKKGRGEEH